MSDKLLDAIGEIQDWLKDRVQEHERQWREGDFDGKLRKPKSAYSDEELAEIRSGMELTYVKEKELMEDLIDFIEDEILTFDKS